jgi:hypothetical protein
MFRVPRLTGGALYLRRVEQADGSRWACRHGLVEFDTQPFVDERIKHITPFDGNLGVWAADPAYE